MLWLLPIAAVEGPIRIKEVREEKEELKQHPHMMHILKGDEICE